MNTCFQSQNEPNSWICFEFKNYHLIPSNYVIRTYKNEHKAHPKTWVIEGSNDKEKWIPIDEQKDWAHLNGKSRVHAFQISESNQKPFKFIKMRLTGFGN